MIRVICPNQKCRQVSAADNRAIGKRVRCGGCRQIFIAEHRVAPACKNDFENQKRPKNLLVKCICNHEHRWHVSGTGTCEIKSCKCTMYLTPILFHDMQLLLNISLAAHACENPKVCEVCIQNQLLKEKLRETSFHP